MKTEFIPKTDSLPPEEADSCQCANNIHDAYEIAPWAATIIEVANGYRAFESDGDREQWEAQL